MVRSKVNLKFIEDNTARKVTYKKRVKGLVKKTEELSVLCGIDACTVVFGPNDAAPVIWPSSQPDAREVLVKYKGKPDLDQGQRKLDQEAFLKQSLTKSDEKMMRLQRRNRELNMENVISDILAGRPVEQVWYNDMGDLLWVIDDRLRSVQHRMRNMEGQDPANVAANPVGLNHQAGPSNLFEALAGPSNQAGPSNPFETRATRPSTTNPNLGTTASRV